ncbi:MAG: hypothetical protein OYM47_02745 [Gemmatimonadota bacterium]|nr:hypothetical protein [Gemmatimonadota bacterium]
MKVKDLIASLETAPDADCTSQREAFRRYLTVTVQPLAAVLERELADTLDALDTKLKFELLYDDDLQDRATAFQTLIAGGLAVREALVTSGLIAGE